MPLKAGAGGKISVREIPVEIHFSVNFQCIYSCHHCGERKTTAL
jgi:hypothetical protein